MSIAAEKALLPRRDRRRWSRPRWWFAAGACLFMLLLAACSSPAPPPQEPIDVDQLPQITATVATGTPAGTPTTAGAVAVADFLFLPATIQVRRGGRVTWTDNGRSVHHIVADSGTWDLGQVAPGQSVAETFSQPGTYRYHCTIHPAMRGIVVVQ